VTITLLTGDCRNVLPTLAANSVHMVCTSPPYWALRSYLDASHPDKHRELGSEPTPDEYLAAMVGVFREVRRVLRPDGTVWCNIGDSYANTGNTSQTDFSASSVGYGGKGRGVLGGQPAKQIPRGLKPKDLLLMPARLALALQADGWWVRSDIIWAKPNPMPESCTDRPTSAYEHVFLLTKAARYFYDADAVREPSEEPWRSTGRLEQHGSKDVIAGVNNGFGIDGLRPRLYNPVGRNLRNVWTIATHAFPEAHFATYPTALVERCIKAGTSQAGCCAACGAPWVRVTEAMPDSRKPYATRGTGDKAREVRRDGNGHNKVLRDDGLGGDLATIQRTTTGWSPSCKCGATTEHFGPFIPAEPVPCTILDPFLGSGTTALVADRLQRHCIGIDLSLTYAELARNRIEQDCPLFTSWAPAEDPEDERMRDLFAEAAE
jgi:DNA modification methylase